MEKVKITEEKKASLIRVFSHWLSFPGLVPTSPQEDCKLWICVCGYSIEALLRQATFLLWAVGAVQVAESVREMRFWWHSVRMGLRQAGRTPRTLRIAAEGEVGPS